MLFSSLLVALLPCAALAFSDPEVHARSRIRARDVLQKRQSFTGRATFYDVGLGACGGYNVGSDWIVAQNSAQYGGGYPGPNCGKSITISYGGKTAVATIRDECPTCGYGDLDFSRGLFDYFASESVGQFQMTWWYNDGSSNQQQQQPTTTSQTPTSTYTPPSSTYTPPSTTSTTPAFTQAAASVTAAATTTSSSSTASSSATSSGSVSSSGSSNSTLIPDAYNTKNVTASPTGTGGAAPTGVAAAGNLAMINQAVANMGNIVVVAAKH